MFQPVRTAISLALLAGSLWAAFTVEIGTKTFAEHVDTISDTPEAKQLIEDTRSTINPALVEVRDRVLGEYVEAPTWIPEPPSSAMSSSAPGTSIAADQEHAPPLPGEHATSLRRQRGQSSSEHKQPLPGRAQALTASSEPRLPGRG